MLPQIITLKKNSIKPLLLVLFLGLFTFISCVPKQLVNTKVNGKQVPVDNTYATDNEIESFIASYRKHINNDLDSTLAWAPVTFTKRKGKWQTNIGNLMADVTFTTADKLLYAREKKHVDVCLLNHGGIRATIPEGKVTARTGYQIMPFENNLIVMALKGEQINAIAAYFIKGKKAHPIAGMEIVLDKQNNLKKITVQGQPVVPDKIYYVATSDYLANGGDNMVFFKEAIASYKMDYKLRNLYIDYFKTVDTLPVNNTKRIIIE